MTTATNQKTFYIKEHNDKKIFIRDLIYTISQQMLLVISLSGNLQVIYWIMTDKWPWIHSSDPIYQILDHEMKMYENMMADSRQIDDRRQKQKVYMSLCTLQSDLTREKWHWWSPRRLRRTQCYAAMLWSLHH